MRKWQIRYKPHRGQPHFWLITPEDKLIGLWSVNDGDWAFMLRIFYLQMEKHNAESKPH